MKFGGQVDDIYVRIYMLTRTIRTAENRLTLPVFKEALHEVRQRRQAGVTAFFTAEAYGTDQRPGGGGLGTLGWDMMQQCADSGLPVVFVSIAHRTRQEQQFIVDRHGNDFWQDDVFVDSRPCDNPNLVKVHNNLHIKLQGREISLTIFGTLIEGTNGNVPGFLLSSANCEIPGFSEITDKLYPGKHTPFYTLGQEIILGMGGAQLLKSLHIPVEIYHMNDGHPAMAAVQLLSQMGVGHEGLEAAMAELRQRMVYTSHTLVGAANEMHSIYDLYDLVRDDNTRRVIEKLGLQFGSISMIKTALSAAGKICAVSRLNAELFKRSNIEHADRIVGGITNAVNPDWASPSMAELFDRVASGWETEPEKLGEIKELRNDPQFIKELWDAHMKAKQTLVSMVKERKQSISDAGLIPDVFGRELDPEILTIGFARRVASYKRHDLLVKDIAKFLAAVGQDQKIQFVFAGKAHPMDNEPGGGKYILQALLKGGKELNAKHPDQIKFVFLPNYDVEMARVLIPGVDVWMNNPIWGHEASGTSTMDAVLNGVPLLTTNDGCVPEMAERGDVGWIFGKVGGEDMDRNYADDAFGLYAALRSIADAYYHARGSRRPEMGQPSLWTDKMISAIADVTPYFLTPRQIKQYMEMMWSPT